MKLDYEFRRNEWCFGICEAGNVEHLVIKRSFIV